MNIPKRSGDHSFYQIGKLPKNLTKVEHKGKFIFGVGEQSNHNHCITVEKPQDLEILKDDFGNYYFNVLSDGILTHELGTSGEIADHKPIIIKKGLYKQIHEREVDIFTKLTRRVID